MSPTSHAHTIRCTLHTIHSTYLYLRVINIDTRMLRAPRKRGKGLVAKPHVPCFMPPCPCRECTRSTGLRRRLLRRGRGQKRNMVMLVDWADCQPDLPRLAVLSIKKKRNSGKERKKIWRDHRHRCDAVRNRREPPQAMLLPASDISESAHYVATDITVSLRMLCHDRRSPRRPVVGWYYYYRPILHAYPILALLTFLSCRFAWKAACGSGYTLPKRRPSLTRGCEDLA
jgi:hypothetical protein